MIIFFCRIIKNASGVENISHRRELSVGLFVSQIAGSRGRGHGDESEPTQTIQRARLARAESFASVCSENGPSATLEFDTGTSGNRQNSHLGHDCVSFGETKSRPGAGMRAE